MVLLAAESVPEVSLPAEVSQVLAGVFEHLSDTARQVQNEAREAI